MYIVTEAVANELRSIRNRKGKSIEEVASIIGIHPNTLGKYEKHTNMIPLDILEKLLEYYEIDELIFFKIIREYNHIDI